ncbi:MAG: hypothetical protein LQ343_007767 [Gyalolechia ehrenbergii]|nr:MAG: hypothetical protein LQ343_007767 [Gyalolechia ehrenbergii]
MAATNFPRSMPVVWLQAPNTASLDRSLAELRSSISNLPYDPSTNQQVRSEGWICEPSGNFRYVIQCPGGASVGNTIMQTEPTPQQTKETRDERYQRILQRRQEAEEREIRKRKRSPSPAPEVGQNLNVPTVSSELTTLQSDNMTLDTDGYPTEGRHPWDNMTLDTDGYPIERGRPRYSPSVASTASLEQRAQKKIRVGDWLEGVKSESVESETVENQTVENGNGEIVSETVVATRVIRPLRRSPRH